MTTVTRTPGPGRVILDVALKGLENKTGKVGWFASSVYPDGTPVAYIAAIQEFGYAPKNIPPRMGLRAMTDEKRGEWSAKAQAFAKRVFDGSASGDDLMELIGAVAEADIRKQIASVVDPPLAASTLRTRASRLGISVDALSGTGSKPLIEPKQADGSPGGYMLATVTHIVSNDASDSGT